jgi:dienelactone hydrolase
VSVRERALTLRNADADPLRTDVRLPDGAGPFPVVVIVPGYKGFKDWGMFPPTGRRLAEAGVASVAVNPSHNGVGESLTEFDEPERFARNTPGREAADVAAVLDAVAAGRVDDALDPDRIGLLGHSRGGGVVLLAASGDARVRAVVTWASIAHFDRSTERAKTEWRRLGYREVPNLRTGQILREDVAVLEDLERHRDAYDLEDACRRMEAPLLALHGELDEAVPAAEAEKLAAWSGHAASRAEIVPKAGHTFGAVHPWAGPTAAWEATVDATARWFRDRP